MAVKTEGRALSIRAFMTLPSKPFPNESVEDYAAMVVQSSGGFLA